MINNLSLPKNLSELSNITNENYPVDKWSGAVVLLVIEDSIVFIKRSETMPSHKGQIGFFGGHKKSTELEPAQTALREFEEETSINRNKIEVLGLSRGVKTSRNRVIIPVVCEYKGSISEFKQLAISNGEWTDLIITKINELLDISFWTKASMENRYSIYFFGLNHFNSQLLRVSGAKSSIFSFVLWGATAKMILLFFKKHIDDGS